MRAHTSTRDLLIGSGRREFAGVSTSTRSSGATPDDPWSSGDTTFASIAHWTTNLCQPFSDIAFITEDAEFESQFNRDWERATSSYQLPNKSPTSSISMSPGGYSSLSTKNPWAPSITWVGISQCKGCPLPFGCRNSWLNGWTYTLGSRESAGKSSRSQATFRQCFLRQQANAPILIPSTQQSL